MKKSLFILSVAALTIASAILPNNASAYSYGSRKGVYSQRTTAYSSTYSPVRAYSHNYNYNSYSYGNTYTLRMVNPFEARRVDYMLSQERYEKQLAGFKAQADAKYARERAQRLRKEEQLAMQTKQRMAAAAQQKQKFNRPNQPASTVNKNTAIVSNADFDLLSNSLDQNANFNNYRQPRQQVVSMADTTNQPSFFKRLKWALFGKN